MASKDTVIAATDKIMIFTFYFAQLLFAVFIVNAPIDFLHYELLAIITQILALTVGNFVFLFFLKTALLLERKTA